MVAEMETALAVPYLIHQFVKGIPLTLGLGGILSQKVQHQAQGRFASYARKFRKGIHRILHQLRAQIHRRQK